MNRHCLLLSLLFATAASAQAPAGNAGFLERHDRDGDGKISLEEFAGYTGEAFGRYDRDRNGVLSADEAPKALKTTGDLDADQFNQKMAEFFLAHDANGDRLLDAGELAAARRSITISAEE